MNMIPMPADPVLVDAVHHCSLRCGPGAKERLRELGRSLQAYDCAAKEFYCKACHQRWSITDISGEGRVDTMACSNCYSDSVLIIKVKVTFVRFPKS